MMWWYGWHWWGGLAMTLGFVGFWALVAWVIATLVRGTRGRGAGREWTAPPTPEQTLAERFARGEIDEQEYRRRLAVLRDQDRYAEQR